MEKGNLGFYKEKGSLGYIEDIGNVQVEFL